MSGIDKNSIYCLGSTTAHLILAASLHWAMEQAPSRVAPLLMVLNSCAPGVAVVNIDDGFGAGYLAGLTNQRWLGQE